MIGDDGEPPWNGRMFCSTCGCPRETVGRCPECGDVAYSLVPNPQHEGWLRRRRFVQAEFAFD